MANATPVHRSAIGASFTKAGVRCGLQHSMLQQCRRALWVQKLTVAGCLA